MSKKLQDLIDSICAQLSVDGFYAASLIGLLHDVDPTALNELMAIPGMTDETILRRRPRAAVAA